MQKIRIDFDNPGLPQHISAVENDSQSRFFQVTLYENGKAYTAPEGAAYSIMYRGFGPQNQGWYDTINDGAGKRAACAVSGNVVTCEIARQALQVPGHVSIVLCVTTGKGYMLKSWPIECDCKNDRYDSAVEIQSFFYVTNVSNASWMQVIQAVEELKNTIDPTLSVSGKAADAAKVGEAINAESERAKGVENQIKEDLDNAGALVSVVLPISEFPNNNNWYYDDNGTKQSTNSWRSTDYLQTYGMLLLHLKVRTFSGVNVQYVAFWDKDKKFISGHGGTVNDVVEFDIDIPDNAVYVTFSMFAQDTVQYVEYKKSDILKNKYRLNVRIALSYSEFDIAGNYYVDRNGENRSTDSWITTKRFPVGKSTVIKANLRGNATVSSVSFYDKYGKYLSGVGFDDGINHLFDKIPIPDNAWWVSFCAIAGDTVQYIKIDSDRIELMENEERAKVTASPLYRKVMAATGDSITATVFYRPWAGYAKIIANRYEMPYTSNAIWGATLARNIKDSSGCILDTLAEMPNADYIVLSGGANDCYAIKDGREALGTITAGYDESFDESTMCGALESMCKTAINKWNTGKILYVITHRILDVYNPEYLDGTVDKIVEVLRKWGIPYVDLWHDIPSLGFASKKNLYTTMGNSEYHGTGDGLHPNYEGYIKYYCHQIESKLNSI
nr:MAG TPA: GDSL like Lipase Acylhydrolase [Caudoviricetes sp.]